METVYNYCQQSSKWKEVPILFCFLPGLYSPHCLNEVATRVGGDWRRSTHPCSHQRLLLVKPLHQTTPETCGSVFCDFGSTFHSNWSPIPWLWLSACPRGPVCPSLLLSSCTWPTDTHSPCMEILTATDKSFPNTLLVTCKNKSKALYHAEGESYSVGQRWSWV